MTLLPFLLKEFEIPNLSARNLTMKLDDKIKLWEMTRKQVICLDQIFEGGKFDEFKPKELRAYFEGVYVIGGTP